MVTFRSHSLDPHGNSTQYLLDKRLSGPQCRYGLFGGKVSYPLRESTQGLLVVQLAA